MTTAAPTRHEDAMSQPPILRILPFRNGQPGPRR